MRMVKKICTYAVGTVLCRLIMYVLLPIYTRSFSVAVYGEASVSLSTANIITSLAYMEIWAAFLRFGYEELHDEFKTLFSTTISIALVLTPLYVTITVVTALMLNLQYVPLMILYGLSLALFNIEQYLCRIRGKQKLYVISGVVCSALQLGASLILYKSNVLDSSVILLLPALGNIAGSALIYCLTYREQRYSIKTVNSSEIRKLVRFSLPLSLNSIAFWGMTNIGSYIARAHLGSSANGYISVANKFTAIILLAVSVYNLAWQETAFEHANDTNREKLYSKEFARFVDIMCVITIGAIIGIDIIFPYYIGEDYATSRILLPIYLCGSLVNSISTYVGVIYSVAKRNSILVWSTVIGCFVSAITVLCTIDTFGVISVPISLLIGMSVNTLFRFALLRNQINIVVRLNWKHTLFVIFLPILALVTVYCSKTNWIKAVFGIAVLALFLIKYKSTVDELLKMIRVRKQGGSDL